MTDMITAENFIEFMNELKGAYTISSTDSHISMYSLAMTVKTYNRIQWFAHCGKAYHLPARKIRKCHMRKIAQRRQTEKRRWL